MFQHGSTKIRFWHQRLWRLSNCRKSLKLVGGLVDEPASVNLCQVATRKQLVFVTAMNH